MLWINSTSDRLAISWKSWTVRAARRRPTAVSWPPPGSPPRHLRIRRFWLKVCPLLQSTEEAEDLFIDSPLFSGKIVILVL